LDEDAPGALGAAPRSRDKRVATASAPIQRPLALAALVGLVVTAVPSLGAHLLTDQTISDAGAHARPLIALVLVAPLAAVMLVAVAADWLQGRVSPVAAVRQLSAIALVAACFFVAVLGMEQDVLALVGAFLLIGGAVGLGIAFALGRNTDSSGPVLAMVGWAACAFLLVLQLVVASLVTTDTCTVGRCPLVSVKLALLSICGGAFLLAIFIGVTMVPLGGWLGSQLRGHE
jgi:hypothetical protein